MADQLDNLQNHILLDPDEMYTALEEKLRQQPHPVDIGRVRAAYEMAKSAHTGQKRKDGSPYVTHCVAAADIAADMGLDEDNFGVDSSAAQTAESIQESTSFLPDYSFPDDESPVGTTVSGIVGSAIVACISVALAFVFGFFRGKKQAA